MLINIIKSYRDVVAVCDSDLLGKEFEEQGYKLNIKEDFYNSKSARNVSEDEAIDIIKAMSKEDATFNIVGENSIKAALKSGIIKKHGIKKIQGIPFAMTLL